MPYLARSCWGASRNDYKEQISLGSAALYKLDLRNDSGKIRPDSPNLGRHGALPFKPLEAKETR